MDFFAIGIIAGLIFIVLINYIFFYDRKKFRYRKNLPPRPKVPAVPAGEPAHAAIPKVASDEFVYAGLLRRFGAYLVDVIIIYFILVFGMVLLVVVSNSGADTMAMLLILVFYPFFVLYFAVFDARLLKLNATPGKKLLSIVVIDRNSQPLLFRTSFARAVLKAIPFMLIFGVLIPFTRNHRALWDMIMKTNVVFDPDKEWIGKSGA